MWPTAVNCDIPWSSGAFLGHIGDLTPDFESIRLCQFTAQAHIQRLAKWISIE